MPPRTRNRTTNRGRGTPLANADPVIEENPVDQEAPTGRGECRGRGRPRGRGTVSGRGTTRGRGRPRTQVTIEDESVHTTIDREDDGPINRNQVDDIVTQRLTAAIPVIIAQLRADEEKQRQEEENPEEPEGEREPEREKTKTAEGSSSNATGCSYKTFMGCKQKDLNGNEGTIKVLRWIDEMEAILDISNCAEKDKVRFVTHSLKSEALEWWNTIVQTRGRQEANGMSWAEFTNLLTKKYCPANEMEKLQVEFLSLSMIGKDVQGYTQRFNALARLLPYLVTPETQKVNRYVWGLEPRVRSYVKAAQPASMASAIELAAIVTDDRVRMGDFQGNDERGKRKVEEGRRQITYGIEGRGQKRSWNDRRVQDKWKRQRVYQNVTPVCNQCQRRHQGECCANTCP